MIYTANYNGNSVTAVDPSAWTPTTIVAGTNPAAVVTNPRLNEIYVVNFGGNNVTIIDGTSYATSQVAAGTNPCAIALNPATDKVYVCNRGSNNVTIIDGATHGASTVAVGSSPRNLAVDPERNRIYVSNYSGDNVTVIEGATLATTTVATGLQPQGVAVDPVRNVAYVANSGAGNCTVINGATYATSTIPLGISSPSIVGMSGHTNEIYVLNAGNSFALIDGVAKTAKTYTTDWQANAIALSLDTNLGNAVFLAGADSKIHMYGDSFKSAAHPNPLTTSITALSGNSCTTHTPTLTGSSVNARHPDNSNIKKVFYAIDDIRGMWKEATITGGAGSTTVTWQAVLQESLTTGLHRIYAFALDATCGTIMGQSWSANTPFTGAISSYAFSVSPAPGQDRWSDSFADGDISDWTIVNGGGTVGLDPVTYFSPPFSLHVQGASGLNEFASVQSPEVSFDSTKEYQISFRFRYTDFHWDQFLIFGHIRLLLDYPYLPMRFDPVGDYSYQYVPGSAPVAAYLPPEVWGLVTVAVSPASRTYTIWINETLVGTVAYLASLIPTNRVYLEDNPGQSNFLTANYDDFSVIGLGTPGAEVGDEPSWGEDLFLWQNAPNPFGGATTIAFRIPKATKVSLELYDLQGKLVRSLADGTQSAGTHPIVWDGRSNEGHRVVSGVYYYRLKTPGYEKSRKLVLLR
jgi:YVTN family beta-propeller protein